MVAVADILSASLETVLKNMDAPQLLELHEDTNIFDNVDSFAIVDLLLETESQLETQLGHYIPLADETIFDADKSPLKKWSNWVQFVESRLAQ